MKLHSSLSIPLHFFIVHTKQQHLYSTYMPGSILSTLYLVLISPYEVADFAIPALWMKKQQYIEVK